MQFSEQRAVLSRTGVVLSLVAAVVLVGITRPIWFWALPALLTGILPALTCATLLLLPGLALIRLLWPAPLPLDQRLPLAVSLSCIVPPLLLLLSDQIGLRWNSLLAWLLLLICALLAFWPRPRPAQSASATNPLMLLALVLITIASLASRLYATRNLVIGAFGDSVHHTILAQLLVEHGGLFRSWEPYAPLSTLTYHYGFQSLAAWQTWLTGMPTRLSLVLVGQVQSALAAPLLYLLTLRLTGSRPAALWAALLVGVVAVMPSFYASWGRYTQLGGQTVLIGLCVVWMQLLDTASEPLPAWPTIARYGGMAALTTAGMILTHYRVTVFAACFVVVYAVYVLATRIRSRQSLARLVATGLAFGLFGLALTLPWLLRLREGRLLRIGTHFVSKNIGTEDVSNITASLITMIAPWHLSLLAIAGLGLLIWRRQWRGLLLPCWAALIGLAANPFLIGLNGTGLITNFAVLIASYLLLVPLAGVTLAEIGGLLRRLPWGTSLGPAVGVALATWGLSWQPYSIDYGNEIFRPDDLAAMTWIKQETPADARFFVNSFTAYGNTLYAGSDGGWLLTFFTGRSTNLPPLTYGSEASPIPDYLLHVNAENAVILAHPINTAEAVAALKAAGFSYLYNGPAASPPTEYLDPAKMNASPFYEQVYHRDGVTIWKVR
ncbi:MAG: hypothetical protein HGA65_05225 [Oscillochloris sp.]|nr:hypothetical protein [Oscillochloris sp.]